jgi:type III pantothenate kinase
MLLVIDVGNTSITFGVFNNDNLISSFNFKTNKKSNTERFSLNLVKKFSENSLDPSLINASIISSVVPELKVVIDKTIKNITGFEPIEVSHSSKTNMSILYDNPKEVGADRIVNSVAAYSIFKKSIIVVDFGTATTFDCISAEGAYLGGAIAPGIKISSDALTLSASKLPRVNIEKPRNIIGKNTVESMQAGIFYGYVSLVDGMIRYLKKSMQTNPVVISTGGFSKIISDESEFIKHCDEFLALKGLQILYKLNG